MANGFCPALLNHFADIAENNYAGNKVTMPGFTKFLYDQQNRVSVGDQGHRRTVTFKYLQRGTPNQVSTSPGCTVDAVPAFIETTVPLTMFVQKGIFLGEDTIRQYCEDHSRTTAIGNPGTSQMAVVVEALYASMNSLYDTMEKDLMTKLGLNMGVHVETGTAAAVTINFEQDGTLNDLDTGITALLTRAQNNELCGAPSMIYGMGSLFHHFDNQAKAKAFGLASSGVDISKLISSLGYAGYASRHVTTPLGDAQNIAMVSPDQIWLVENMRNKGSFAGTRGTSTFGTLIDPRTQCWGNLPVEWDFQAKYIDCAEDLHTAVGNGYINSNTITEDRGYLIILSKYYDLFVTPNNAFEGGDRIAGGGRPLLYTISNS